MRPRSRTHVNALVPWTCALLAFAAPPAATARQDEAVAGPQWPRWFERDGKRLCLHQPQADRWHDFRTLSARAVVAVYTSQDAAPEYGAIRFTAPTVIDVAAGAVAIGRRSFAGARFPDTDPDRYIDVRDVVEDLLGGNQPIVTSLDEIIAYLDLEVQPVPEVRVELDPPRIRWVDRPAIVLAFDGEPRFEAVAGTSLMTATNASWDVLLDLAARTCYLLWDDAWIATNDLEHGPWSPAHALPDDLSRLPDTPEWAAIRACVPGAAATTAPLVLSEAEQVELIVTDGPPRTAPLADTGLEVVTNTDSDLLRCPDDGRYYLLTGGRWFRAAALEGPWSEASDDLPPAFASIPRDGAHAHLLASVPGTLEARAAVLLAAVPRTATIRRDALELDVAYAGEPSFLPIDGADGVSCAVNTDDEVFLVGGFYYCCHEGVWFGAEGPTGPWIVADRIPPQIYTIPWKDPHHRVTYVHVYEADEETVTVGQTAGYAGELIALGLVTAGLGYAIAQADSASVRVSAGPITVRGRYRTGEEYDELSGDASRSRSAHGPYAGARVAAAGSDPYRRLGSAVIDDRSWVRGGAASSATAGPARPAEDVYAGLDGNVYRRGQDGSWQQRMGGGWSALDRTAAQDRTARLDRQFQSRSFGTQRAQRSRGRRR